MKKLILAIFQLLMVQFLSAHPGPGIVKDNRGNIYYTDLKQIWKISPDGKSSVVVPGVHSHELYMDADNSLYGEHLWYNGEEKNTWGYFYWKLNANGKLDILSGPNEGFPEGYSFCRDSLGNQYWAERWKISRIRKKSPDGIITTLVSGKFNDIRWMHVTPKGHLYFTDEIDLYQVDTSGNLSLLVKNLAEAPSLLSTSSRKHSIFGIWNDQQQNIYAAVYSMKTVKKISPDGKVSDFCFSIFPWAPVGGVFDDQGNLWLLESSTINETRVRKITGRMAAPTKFIANTLNLVIPLSIGGSILLVVVLMILKLRWRLMLKKM
jgi:hypothetical protein